MIRYTKKIAFVIILILVTFFAYNVFQKGNYGKVINGKQVIRVKYTHQWSEFKAEEIPLLFEIIDKNFYFENAPWYSYFYDLQVDGPFNKRKIKKFIIEKIVRNKNAAKLYYTGEAGKTEFTEYDMSIGFEFALIDNYIRVPLYYNYYREKVSTNYARNNCQPKKENFACFLYSNNLRMKVHDGVIARNSFFEKLSNYKKVISGGRVMNNIGYEVPRDKTIEWLSSCKFIIAYENQVFDGYMTEKPFQAYYAGAIPIYYGSESSFKTVNKNAMIYRGDFSSDQEMIDYIIKLDNNDELYCNKWKNKIIDKPQYNYENIKAQLEEKLLPIINEAMKRHKL